MQKFDVLTVFVVMFIVLATAGIALTKLDCRKTAGVDVPLQNEDLPEDWWLQAFLEHEKQQEYLREIGWFLVEPDKNLIQIQFSSGITRKGDCGEVPNSYKLVAEKIKEIFPEAVIVVLSYSLDVEINPTGKKEKLLTMIVSQEDYKFGSRFKIIGTPTIEKADEIIKNVAIAWTRARHPAISDHDVQEYIPPRKGNPYLSVELEE